MKKQSSEAVTLWRTLEFWLNRVGNLDILQGYYQIHISHDPETNLYCFKYTDGSPRFHWITRACRGTVFRLDQEGRWVLVAGGFLRFYNLGEAPEIEKKFDWLSFYAQEKWDGSLVKLFNWQGKWIVSSSGTPTGSAPIHPDYEGSFSDLYWEAFHRKRYNLDKLDPSIIYVQELITPFNKIVVNYKHNWSIIDLCCRSAETFEEVRHPHPQCKALIPYLANATEVKQYVEQRPGTEHEGLVLVDCHGNRLKVKSEEYVSLSYMSRGGRKPNLVPLWQFGNLQELVDNFPSLWEEVETFKSKVKQDVESIQPLVNSYQGNMAEFAQEHKGNPNFGIAANAIRNHGGCIESALKTLLSSTLEERYFGQEEI